MYSLFDIHEENKKRFLSHFPPNQRRSAVNFLTEAVKAGCKEPNQVVGYAIEKAKQKASRSETARLFLLLAEVDPDALLAGARWVLWWESLALGRGDVSGMSREQAIEQLRAWIPGLERVVKYNTTPPTYALFIRGQRVDIGRANHFLNQRTLRIKVAGACLFLPMRVDRRTWDGLLRRLLVAIEVEEPPRTQGSRKRKKKTSRTRRARGGRRKQ